MKNAFAGFMSRLDLPKNRSVRLKLINRKLTKLERKIIQ